MFGSISGGSDFNGVNMQKKKKKVTVIQHNNK